MAAKKKKWIQSAIKNPGALKRTAGKRGRTKKGTIKVKTLNKLAKKKGVTGQRARLAKNLRAMNKKRR
jgi:hypothetical protein